MDRAAGFYSTSFCFVGRFTRPQGRFCRDRTTRFEKSIVDSGCQTCALSGELERPPVRSTPRGYLGTAARHALSTEAVSISGVLLLCRIPETVPLALPMPR